MIGLEDHRDSFESQQRRMRKRYDPNYVILLHNSSALFDVEVVRHRTPTRHWSVHPLDEP